MKPTKADERAARLATLGVNGCKQSFIEGRLSERKRVLRILNESREDMNGCKYLFRNQILKIKGKPTTNKERGE